MADLVNVTEDDELTKINRNKRQNVFKVPEKLKIGYVYSPELVKQCDRVPNLIERVYFIIVNINHSVKTLSKALFVLLGVHGASAN
jgi:hypothetical protein